MKKKILVIDDEIHGLRSEMYTEHAEDFFLNLTDLEQEETKKLHQIITDYPEHFKSISLTELTELSPQKLFKEYFNKDFFRSKNIPLFSSSLDTIYSISDSLLKVKTIIESSFPEDSYDITLKEDIPPESQINNLQDYELLIVDLKLKDKNSKYFLRSISKLENLPPIILISSHFNTEKYKLSDYFEETHISSTGLTLLSKEDLKNSENGVIKLKLLADQLVCQRRISNNTKNLIKTWDNVLEKAKNDFSKILWKLDATIMQRIHTDSVDDHVLFSDMINNFLIKELLWNIEESEILKESTKKLEEAFINKNDRMLAYESDIDAHRTLLSHHFYSGGSSKEIDLLNAYCKHPSGKTKNKAHILSFFKKNLLTILPFGGVFSDHNTNSILINITQQCNLTGIYREEKSALNSLLFIQASISKLSNSDYVPYNSNSLVSILHKKNPSEVTDFIDINPNSKQLLSCSLNDFIGLIKKNNLKLIGRMRSEHVTALQQDTALTILKPAQTRISRLGSCKFNITLLKKDNTSENFPHAENGQEFIALKNDKYMPSDRLAIDISIWLKVHLPDLDLTPKEILDEIIQARKIDSTKNLRGFDLSVIKSKTPLPNHNGKKHSLIIKIEV